MTRFTIRDETVHAAFDLLERNVETASVAAAMRERREDERKAAYSRVYLETSGTVAERDATVRLSNEYQEACERLYEAIVADVRAKKEEAKCAAIIDAWRTCQSNMRNMSRVA